MRSQIQRGGRWFLPLCIFLLIDCHARTSTEDLLSVEGVDVALSFDVASITMNVGEQRTFSIRGGKAPFTAKVLGTGTATVAGRNCIFTAAGIIDAPSIIVTDALGKQASLTVDAVGVGVQPTDISGLALWLKADAMSHPDDTTIAAWPDSSGYGRNFTASGLPKFHTGFVNGLPVITFTGGMYLERGNMDAGFSTFTFTLFLLHYPATTVAGSCAFSTRDTPLNGYWICTGPSNLLQTAFGNHTLGGVWNSLYAVTALSTNAWFLSEVRVDSETYGVFQNAVLQSQVSKSAVAYDPATTGASIRVGENAANYYSGKIAEVILFDHALSLAEVQSIRCYLKKKYALSYGC